MSERVKTSMTLKIWQRFAALAVLAAAIVAFGRFSGFMRGYGVALVLLGGAALALISYSILEIAEAFRHAAGGTKSRPAIRTSALFWESMARNFRIMIVIK